jgi:hypothetical protein
MNTEAQKILLTIEKLKDQRDEIGKRVEHYHRQLTNIKDDVIKSHNHLIGKYSVCEVQNKFGQVKSIKCECTALRVNDDYETVTPLFSQNGTKVSVISSTWDDKHLNEITT